MKTKITYALFILLLIVVLASALFTYWLNQQQTRITPETKEPLQEMPETKNHLTHSTQVIPVSNQPETQLPSVAASSILQIPGITIISQEPTTQVAQERRLSETQQIKKTSLQPVPSASTPISSGYKKIGKTPPEAENKEMNQQGIIMY